MTFTVIVDPEAKADLLRLYEHLLERVEYVEDLDIADRALEAIDGAIASLARSPFLFRKAAGSRNTLRRELVIPFGASGYVLKYEIASPQLVVVLAVRHQHEADYH
jgi:plasmid stabilization system protein ParE